MERWGNCLYKLGDVKDSGTILFRVEKRKICEVHGDRFFDHGCEFFELCYTEKKDSVQFLFCGNHDQV